MRKLSDGRTDGQTDGQTDGSDFIGCCPTNVERPIDMLMKRTICKTCHLEEEFLSNVFPIGMKDGETIQ